MVNVNEMMQQTGAVEALSRELAVDQSTAQAGATALLPSILSGLKDPVQNDQPDSQSAFPALGGLEGLFRTVGGLGGGALLDNVTSSEPTEINKGNQILEQVFGSKDGSRAVAASAAAQSGLEPSLLKKMLPVLAMLVAGYVMKQAQTGGLGGALGSIVGGQQTDDSAQGPGAGVSAGGGILGELIGAAGKYLGR